MKRWALVAITAILLLASAAFALTDRLLEDDETLPMYRSKIAMLPWNQSNIDTLRSLDKTQLVDFLNGWPNSDIPNSQPDTDKIYELRAGDIPGFGWFDLAGDDKYELAMALSSGPCCVFLNLYWQEGPGKFRYQSYSGASEDLNDTIRDLNGDGKKELILDAYVGSATYWGTKPSPMYPQVYRLQNGEYVEASRDFPNFYDAEVLPELSQEIAKSRNGFPPLHAVQIMERDKILRMLGRDPTAGLQQAREWAASSDPDLIDDASIVFRDIGGHEDEARAADAALKQASAQGGGKN
jgi:hypothetical protein